MINPNEVLDDFRRVTKDHAMDVARDDGLYRHLRFRKPTPNRWDGWFDIITWPEYLCVTGDYGTYIFRRITDMTQFFVDKGDTDLSDLRINAGYWEEKLERSGSEEVRKFDLERFKENVKNDFDLYWEDLDMGGTDPDREKCWEAIEEALEYNTEHEFQAMEAIMEFEYKRSNGAMFTFQDFWEYNNRSYTFHYIWCLYSIVWGIKMYNAWKKEHEPS